MNERKRPVAMVEAGLLTALTVLFTIVGTYIPFLGIAMTLVGLPLAIAGIRNGLKIVGLAAVAASLVGVMIGGIPTGLNVLLAGGGTAMVVTYCYEKKSSMSIMVILLSLVSIMAMAISLKVTVMVLGVDLINIMETSSVDSLEMMKGFAQTDAQYQEMSDNMALVLESIKIFSPSFLAMVGAASAFINVIALRFTLKRLKIPFIDAKPFNEFAYDKSVLIGTSLIMILSYLSGVIGIVDLTVLFVNVVVLIAFAFSIQGAAVLDYSLSRRNIGKGLRIFIIGFLFIAFNGIIFIGMIGWFDVIFNFRKLERNDH